MAKRVPFRPGIKGDLTSRDILVNALETGPAGGQGMTIADLEKRFRTLKKLRDATDSVDLEDADWETLKAAFSGLRWMQVQGDTMGWLLDVKADLFDAKEPPKAEAA